jgi:hypothetical protein
LLEEPSEFALHVLRDFVNIFIVVVLAPSEKKH